MATGCISFDEQRNMWRQCRASFRISTRSLFEEDYGIPEVHMTHMNLVDINAAMYDSSGANFLSFLTTIPRKGDNEGELAFIDGDVNVVPPMLPLRRFRKTYFDH